VTLAVGRLKDTGTNFAAMLRALSTDGNTNIISTPSVITMDNEEAEIKVAQEVPFLTGQYSNTTSGGTGNTVNPFQTIQREEVGTILKITPQITDDNTVLLKISQEVSSLASGSSGAVDLITNKRTITTKALAEDGEILVLGGLISDEVLDDEQRVPLLGSIPVLGQLFKSRHAKKTKTNLMVFIRPKVLRDGEQVAIETNAKYNFMRNEQTRRRGTRIPLMLDRRPLLPELSTISPRGATGTVAVPTTETGTSSNPGAASPPPAAPAPNPSAPIPDSN
jgi:general secretion pathway protein D